MGKSYRAVYSVGERGTRSVMKFAPAGNGNGACVWETFKALGVSYLKVELVDVFSTIELFRVVDGFNHTLHTHLQSTACLCALSEWLANFVKIELQSTHCGRGESFFDGPK